MGAKAIDVDSIRDVRDRCAQNSIAFFFKQCGGARGKRAHDEAILDGELYVAWPT